MTILDRLADHARERVAKKKAELSLTDMKRKALVLPKGNFPVGNMVQLRIHRIKTIGDIREKCRMLLIAERHKGKIQQFI